MASHECDQEREAKILTEALMMEQYKDLWISGHATPGYPGGNSSTPTALNSSAPCLKWRPERYVLKAPLPPAKRPDAVFDGRVNRYVERESFTQLTLPTLLMAKLYDLILEHGHLLGHCQAPAPMKRGPRPKGAKRPKHDGVCGNLFLGAKVGQRYCSPTCAFRVAGHRKRPNAKR